MAGIILSMQLLRYKSTLTSVSHDIVYSPLLCRCFSRFYKNLINTNMRWLRHGIHYCSSNVFWIKDFTITAAVIRFLSL